ncbi:MAG: peptidoglycan DD-metalloendopeptidase family protein [Planctomycetota bacterium]
MKTKRDSNVWSRQTRFWSKSAVVVISTFLLCNAASAVVVDSFNADKSPSDSYWGVSEVGWIYTAGFSFNLTGVRTKFGSGPGSYSRLVTVEVYDELPAHGGILLRSATFTPVANMFAGGGFTPLPVDAGEDYFVGFRDVVGLGDNFTSDPGAQSVSNLHFGLYSTGAYGTESYEPSFTQAILQFEGFQGPVTDPCELDPDRSYRGIAFLSSYINNSISLDEIRNFVSDCSLDLVVIDFAWITYHWPQTDLAAVEQLAAELVNYGVEVVAMYRPRALSPSDAPIHYAQNCDGTTDPSHNHLCFAYEDSRTWGAQWGSDILNALPSVNKVIIYNLLAPCCCPLCQGGQGAAYAEQFMERCRLQWDAVCAGVQVGHVGLGAEYADQVDFFCPFLLINRWGDPNPVDVDALLDDLITPDTQPGHKPVIPLAKICWGSATDNTTEDIINAIESCQNRQTGFILWYYDWIFYTGLYDAQAISAALRGQGDPIPDLTFPYEQAGTEPLPWPHQAPGLTPEEIELLNQQLWVINDFPLYQADEQGSWRYFHGGLDIVLDNGTPIYAMKDGWVKSTDYSTITIADEPGNEPSYGWEYTHLGNFQVQAGDFVAKGAFIGAVDFEGLPHIHLIKVFSEADYWGNWRYMCMPNGHFSYVDDEPPVISTPFYFFENNLDTMIEPSDSGDMVLSGQVDIVVPMREQGLYARSNDSGFGDRLAITKIEYEIRPAGLGPGSGLFFHSFDFNDIKIKNGVLDRQYSTELTKVVYKHWTLFEPQRTSWDKCFSYYIITNCSGRQSPRQLDTADRNYCWDTTALGQDGRHLFGNGTYDIIVTAYDFRGHSSTQAMTVEVDNPQTCWDAAECAGQPLGDATCDGNVALADLFALKAAFGKSAPWPDPECCADFDHDGSVDLGDLFVLKANYASGPYSPSTGNQNCPP